MKKTLLLIGTICSLSACTKDDNGGPNANAQDRTFVEMASRANIAEMETGKLASEKGNDATSWFGMMMHMDHQAAQTELANIAKAQGLYAPGEPDSMHKMQKMHLMGMSGHMFDSAYIHLQVADHANTIALFEQEINNGLNESVRSYAQKHLPKIKMHKQSADSIAATL